MIDLLTFTKLFVHGNNWTLEISALISYNIYEIYIISYIYIFSNFICLKGRSTQKLIFFYLTYTEDTALQ